MLLSVYLGLSAGKRAAQAMAVWSNVKELAGGLDYFYNDQNRYPTALEFQDRNLMLNYFVNFPSRGFASAQCPDTYDYQYFSGRQVELDFCLPTAAAGKNRGWNKLMVSKQ